MPLKLNELTQKKNNIKNNTKTNEVTFDDAAALEKWLKCS